MKVAQLLESRKLNWGELDKLCDQLETRRRKKMAAPAMSRFATLYRAACADLALAESHQLPPNTVSYLQQLVNRAHNQLYRTRGFNFNAWRQELLVGVPQRLFNDPCLKLAFLLFWGVFLLSMLLASEASFPWSDEPPFPGFASRLLGDDQLQEMDNSFAQFGNTSAGSRMTMAGFYIYNNAGIGLRVFACGLIFGVGGLFATVFNAAVIGASFGYMLRSEQGDNFFQFVTAHGPFELTAIILSAAAGMRLGFAIIQTNGLSRIDSLRKTGREALPTAGAAMLLFFLAAMVEAFISPFHFHYEFKAAVAVFSCGLMAFYFILLGRREGDLPQYESA